jgi:xylulokinase
VDPDRQRRHGTRAGAAAQTIGASYGDALLAAIGVGLVGRDADWTTVERTVTPDGANARVYEELYEAYRSLYPATRDQVHLLAGLQESTARAEQPLP